MTVAESTRARSALARQILIRSAVRILVLVGLWIFGIVVTIIGAVRANDGWRYRYPLTIRFI